MGFPGHIKQICVDTNHFKGNYPDSVKIEGAYLGRGDWYPEIDANWHNILKPSKVRITFYYNLNLYIFMDIIL